MIRPLHPIAASLLLAAGLSAGPLAAAPIEVSNKAGQSMTVEVLSHTASSGNVRIQRIDGQIFNTKLEVFDAASQEKIVANAPKEVAKLEMDVSVGKKRRDQGSSTFMENMTITTSAKISNVTRDIDLGETSFTILLVARNSRRYADRTQDWYRILSVQKFSTQLPAGKFSEHELKPVLTSYDSDKDSSNLGGWEFEGYLLVAQDPAGKILATKTSLGTVSTTTVKDEKLILDALKLSEGMETEHDLKPRGLR
ncbi:MAG: hypothetical protein QE273_18065 [Verrucomicrobiales bacterium]|nr:hypothetical protein [Verrucomicrobiales bacterium]